VRRPRSSWSVALRRPLLPRDFTAAPASLGPSLLPGRESTVRRPPRSQPSGSAAAS
jgi:hypothetical protein